MNLNLKELEIIHRLLQNRLNADYDSEIEELSRKFKQEIRTETNRFNQLSKLEDLGYEVEKRYSIR